MNKYCVVFVTTNGLKEAEKITNNLLKKKLAACVNIIPAVHSKYWWKGKIEVAKESLMVIKTREKLIGKLIKEIKKIHSYTVPEIIALPVIKGNPDYLRWINDSVI